MVQPENPYESPFAAGQPTAYDDIGLARQVPIVAILLIVQGVLELLFGLYLVAMAVMFGVVDINDFAPQDGQRVAMPAWILPTIFGGMALCGLVLGSIKIYAGWLNYGYQSFTWGVVALGSCLASCLTIYCLPTGLMLAIYGFIVYFNTGSRNAFTWREHGILIEDVRERLGS